MKNIYRAASVVFVAMLILYAYVSDDYIRGHSTKPDKMHTIPFDAHGDTVYISRDENRNYYLIIAGIVIFGAIGAIAYAIDERRKK
jgi:uncharacterized membrane protein YphA (DoxX/SURF4 family)